MHPPIEPVPRIVRIFSAVNIYVIYGKFNEAHVIPYCDLDYSERLFRVTRLLCGCNNNCFNTSL